jgi:cytochrome P450
MAFALYEMKVVLAEVLIRAALRKVPGYKLRPVRRNITLAPSKGMPLIVEKLHTSA